MSKTGKSYKFSDLVDIKSFDKGFKELNKQLADLHKSMSSTSKIDPKNMSGEDLKKVIAEMKEIERIKKERLENSEKLRKAEKKAFDEKKKQLLEEKHLEKQKQKQAKETAKNEKEASKRLERIRKQKEKNNVTENQANSSLKKTINSENERIKVVGILTKRLKGLNQANVKEKVEYEKLNAVIANHNTILRKAGKARSDDRRNVGNYTSALDKLKGGFSSIAGGLGLAGGVMALGSVMKDAIKITLEFGKASKKLKAILGESGTSENMKLLADQAKRLGAETAFTANQILELDTELAKLGFSAKQIESSVPGIQSLASATGTDLAEAATLAGSTLNIFKLEAKEAGRVADVLALSTTKSALDMGKLAVALPYVGTGARLAGKDLEFTTAQLGTLANNGLDASVSGTSLRKIFSELSKTGMTYEDALKQINESSNKSKTAFELFGATAKDAAVILAESTDKTALLEKSLRSAKGEAAKMSEIMLNNLAGDITKAGSAWEGFILGLEDGEGQFSKISRGLVQFGTAILGSLTNGNALTEVFKSIGEEFSGLFGAISKITSLFGGLGDKTSAVEAIFNVLSVTFTIATTPLRVIIFLATKLIQIWTFLGESVYDLVVEIKDFALSFDFVNIAIDFVIDKFKLFKTAITDLLVTLRLLDKAQIEVKKSAAELQKDKEIQIYLAGLEAEVLAETTAEQEKNTKAKKDAKKALDELNKSTRDYENALKALDAITLSNRTNIDEGSLTNPLDVSDNARNNKLNALEDGLKNLSEAQKAEIRLTENHVNALNSIHDKFNKQRAKIENDLAVKKFKDLQKLDEANFKHQQLILEKTLTEIGLSDKERLEFTKQASLEELDFKILQLQNYLVFVKKNNKDLSNEEELAMQNSILALQVQRIKLDKGTDSQGQNQKDPKTVNDLVKESINNLGFSDEESQLIIDNSTEIYAHLEGLAFAAHESEKERNNELLQMSNDRLQQLQDELTEEEALDKKGIANNKNDVKAKIALEKKKNDELIAEKKKLAEKEKQIAIGKAAISTAVSVVNALLQLPSPKAWIDAAGAAVVGALQIATISKQKFRSGGAGVLQGNSHEQGGIVFDRNKEAEGGEGFGVISQSMTKKHYPLFKTVIDGINSDNLDFMNNPSLLINNDNSKLENGQAETNRHLKSLVEKPDRGFDKNGLLRTEIKGNETIIFNI